MAGRIHERDGPAVGLDLVGADVLGDATALGVDDVRLADAIQQRGLAVVDVAEDRDDRGPGLEVLGALSAAMASIISSSGVVS